jgi:DNA-binding NarL/FixJ family response regulator
MLSQPTRIVVAHASSIVREGILSLLADETDLVIVEAATYEEAMQLCQERPPHLLVVGPLILVPSPAVFVAALQKVRPGTHVLVVASRSEDVRVQTLILAGIGGFVLLRETRSRFVAAVRAVAKGEVWFSRRVMAKLVQETRQAPKTGLTPQQLVVLRLVTQGKTNRQIAQELGIKERTVRFHLEGIFNRLDVKNRAEAVAKAVQEGLLDLEV